MFFDKYDRINEMLSTPENNDGGEVTPFKTILGIGCIIVIVMFIKQMF